MAKVRLVAVRLPDHLARAMKYLALAKGSKVQDEYEQAVSSHVSFHMKGGWFDEKEKVVNEEEEGES